MLLRQDASGTLALPQPGHAWLAGQMALAWGNAGFDPPEPFGPVCLAVEQHDIAWLERDQQPDFDPDTSAPRVFWHVPATEHTRFWSEGVRRARIFGLLPALLISLHGVGIYDRLFDPATASPENAEAVSRFRAEQGEMQRALLDQLRADPATAAQAGEEAVARNRRLLLALDLMSLHACWGLREAVTIADVPSTGGERCDIVLRPDGPGRIIVDPWPFGTAELQLEAEGRRLPGRFADAAALQHAWDEAAPETIRVRLRPA